MKKLTQNKILDLYGNYYRELKSIRTYVKRFIKNHSINTMLDDIEAEIIYLLIRYNQPKTIVEISPCEGLSTLWLLNSILVH